MKNYINKSYLISYKGGSNTQISNRKNICVILFGFLPRSFRFTYNRSIKKKI